MHFHIISSELVLNTPNMVHSIQISNIMKEARRAVTQPFNHQASSAIGSLIAEFTLQFRRYETNYSQGRAFDKDATKLALKTV
jgi:hypothetical protein